MQEYSEINIYIGLPKQINLNKKFFNIYTDIESKPLSDFGKELNKIKNNNYLLINGLPNIEENKKKYFYFYNDSRFNGLIPDENLFKRFPNISITSKFLIKSINLKKYLDLGLLVSNKAKISLIIRQGDISQIFKSIGNWIELINNIKIIGFAQNYLFENFHENKFLEDKGFLKTPSINYLEINYLKSIKENEKNNFIDKKKLRKKY